MVVGTQQLGEQLGRSTPDPSSVALLLVDRSACVVFADVHAEAMFGRAPAELVGQPLEALIPDRPWALHTANAYLVAPGSNGTPGRNIGSDRPLRGRWRDGSEFPVEVNLSPIPTAGGSGSAGGALVAVVVRDRSESTRPSAVDRALREAQERFRLALDEAPIGMALVGLDHAILRVNHALCRMLGYPAHELTGMSIEAVTHPADLDLDLALADRLSRGELATYSIPKRYVHQSGTVVEGVLSVSVVREADGAPLYFIAQVEDVTERNRTEAALLKSEAKFRALFDQAPEGIFIADVDGRYVDVNAAACQMLGYEREELLGLTIFDILPGNEGPRLVDAQPSSLAGWVELWEWTLKRKDGGLVPVEVAAKTLPDGRRQAFMRDISRRRQKEEELRKVTSLLDSIVENVPAMIFVKDAKTLRFERFNRAGEELLGVPRESLIGKSDHDLFPKEQADFFQARDRETLDERRLVTIAEEPIGTSRGTRLLHTMKIPMVDGAGTPTYLLGISMDITDRRRADREREETLRWLRAVLDQSPVGLVLVHGPDGGGVDANRRAIQMAGKDLTGPIAGHAAMLSSPDGQPLTSSDTPSARALAGETSEGVELLLHGAQGVDIPILTSSAPIIGTDGKVQGAVIAFQDITAAKELEHLRAEWGSIVAHDLRQPLQSIAVSAQILALGTNDASLRKYIQRIRSSADRLNRMVDDLMDFSRLDARRLELVRRPVDVAAVVRGCVERMAVQEPNRSFEVSVRGDLRQADADPDRIAQVMENLLTNAIKYGSKETPIDIAVVHAADEVSVAVTNHGKTLSAEELPRLFERFHRSVLAKEGPVKGAGLGLYITRALVEAHGGRIVAESSPAGLTTFRFTLPIAA